MSIGGIRTAPLKPCTVHDLYDGAQPPFVACRWCEVLHKKSRWMRGQLERDGLLQVREFEKMQACRVANELRPVKLPDANELRLVDTLGRLVKDLQKDLTDPNWLRGQWE